MKMRRFIKSDWMAFSGAENLPDGSEPYYGEVKIGGKEYALIASGANERDSKRGEPFHEIKIPSLSVKGDGMGVEQGGDDFQEFECRLPLIVTTETLVAMADQLIERGVEDFEALARLGFEKTC